jgi:hypothetical protein
MGGELAPLLLAGNLVQVGEDVLDGAEVADESLSRLRADARNTRDIVARVSGESHKVHEPGRGDAVALLNILRAKHRIFHRVPEAYPGSQKLEEVLVPGDDNHLPFLRYGPGGQGPDDIVGLEPRRLQDRDAVGADKAFDIRELSCQRFRHLLSRRLIRGTQVVAEGGPRGIEGDGEVLRLPLLEHAREHAEEPIHRVGGEASGRTEVPHPVEGAIDVRASVD